MKRTSLLALLVGFAVIAVLTSNASAYYHAGMGRFINRDPIGYQGNVRNLYVYGSGNPGGSVDPSGEQPVDSKEWCPVPDKELGIHRYPPKDWTLPDVRQYPPETWLSKACRAICAEARKMKLQDKLDNAFGAVVCGRAKSGVPTRCPCVFDKVVDKEVVKWDECPETAYCIFMHELGHITQQSKEMLCNPKDRKPHAARGLPKAEKEFHKKIAKKEMDCLIEAQKALMQNPSYSKEKKRKCTKYNLKARASVEEWREL